MYQRERFTYTHRHPREGAGWHRSVERENEVQAMYTPSKQSPLILDALHDSCRKLLHVEKQQMRSCIESCL